MNDKSKEENNLSALCSQCHGESVAESFSSNIDDDILTD
jgi:hypothetical protein